MSKGLLNKKIIEWSADTDGSKYVKLNNLLEYLEENLFHDFEPSYSPCGGFISRLYKWLNNVSTDEKQKILFKLTEKIFYVGLKEFQSMYKTSYNSIVKKWIVDMANINFTDIEFNKKINAELKHVWFCPITDSFNTSSFYHLNGISGSQSHRPDWRSLKRFTENNEVILRYIRQNKIKYIVLLEDFVGSGTQVKPALKLASSLSPDINVLFIPLIICPKGVTNITDSLNIYPNFRMVPVVNLKETDMVNNDSKINTSLHPLIALLEDTINDVKLHLSDEEKKKTTPFGFKETGSLTVMYTNTPNNSLPVISVETANWTALFKRISRD